MTKRLTPDELRQMVWDLPTGTTIFTHNPKPILCKLIRFGMGGPDDHSAMIVWSFGNPYIAEAKGGEKVHLKSFHEWLRNRADNTFRVSEYELDSAGEERLKSCYGKGYDYKAAIFYMVLFRLTGKWFGPRNEKAKDRYFCFEMSAYIRGIENWWCKVPKDFPETIQKQPA